MKDIAPELLEKIKVQFQEDYKSNKKIQKLLEKLKNKKATYQEANDFALQLGDILSKAFRDNLSSSVLPDGRMYFNIAEKIINDTLHNNYLEISSYAAETQSIMNKQAGLSIKGIRSEINQDRIDGIINRVSSEENFDKIKWILDEPVVNFSQSIVDDTIKKNADTHYKLGLKPKIVRKESGSCCDWCKEVVGVYEYPKVPKGVYRRHRYCRCTVDYHPGDGKRQNIWTKEWKDPEKDANIEARKKIGLDDVKKNNRADDTEQFKKYIEILGTENMPVSVAQFQNLKYNTPDKWERLQDNYYVKSRLKDGRYGNKINIEKQASHMKSTKIEGKSYFEDDVNTQELFNKHAGTGTVEKDSKGRRKNIEVVYLDYNTGTEGSTGNKVNGIKIHHSKNRTHIVPVRGKE